MFGKTFIHHQPYFKFIEMDKMYNEHLEVANSSTNIKQLSC